MVGGMRGLGVATPSGVRGLAPGGLRLLPSWGLGQSPGCRVSGFVQIDELGYLQHAENAANVLFGVVDQRYLRRKPLIFTTNKRLRAWGDVLHDHDLAEVILDRVLERGEHIILGGRSWRTKHVDPEMLGDPGADPESVRNPVAGSPPVPPAS